MYCPICGNDLIKVCPVCGYDQSPIFSKVVAATLRRNWLKNLPGGKEKSKSDIRLEKFKKIYDLLSKGGEY